MVFGVFAVEAHVSLLNPTLKNPVFASLPLRPLPGQLCGESDHVRAHFFHLRDRRLFQVRCRWSGGSISAFRSSFNFILAR